MSDADPIGPVQREAPLRPLDAGRDRPPRPRTPSRDPGHEQQRREAPPHDERAAADDEEPPRRGGQIDELA
jgi:hypothetical protein